MAAGKVFVSAFTERIAGVYILLFLKFYLFQWVEKGYTIMFKYASFRVKEILCA